MKNIFRKQFLLKFFNYRILIAFSPRIAGNRKATFEKRQSKMH
jgi:hypothetical protein